MNAKAISATVAGVILIAAFAGYSPVARAAEALEDLKLPPVPELLETERAFTAEAVDPRWSAETEARIRAEIAQTTGLKLVTLQVECKTSLCRLRVAQKELSGAGPFPQLVGGLGLKPLWVMAVMDRNGAPASLAYLKREGTTTK